MQFPVSETCPKCRKLVAIATVELHPTHPDRAVYNFMCANCGPVKTRIVSLLTDQPPPELAIDEVGGDDHHAG
jgi:ssDNA-binding Zn-finger/Zn-ribbon topoisomerase 1